MRRARARECAKSERLFQQMKQQLLQPLLPTTLFTPFLSELIPGRPGSGSPQNSPPLNTSSVQSCWSLFPDNVVSLAFNVRHHGRNRLIKSIRTAVQLWLFGYHSIPPSCLSNIFALCHSGKWLCCHLLSPLHTYVSFIVVTFRF